MFVLSLTVTDTVMLHPSTDPQLWFLVGHGTSHYPTVLITKGLKVFDDLEFALFYIQGEISSIKLHVSQPNLSPGEQYSGTLSEVPVRVQGTQKCSNSTKGNKFFYIFPVHYTECDVCAALPPQVVFIRSTCVCQLSFACSQTYSDLIQTIQSDSGRIFTPSVTMEVRETKGGVRWGRCKC